MTALARALAEDGRLVVVEPAGHGHIHRALPPDELRETAAAARLVETGRRDVASLPGRAVESVFERRR